MVPKASDFAAVVTWEDSWWDDADYRWQRNHHESSSHQLDLRHTIYLNLSKIYILRLCFLDFYDKKYYAYTHVVLLCPPPTLRRIESYSNWLMEITCRCVWLSECHPWPCIPLWSRPCDWLQLPHNIGGEVVLDNKWIFIRTVLCVWTVAFYIYWGLSRTHFAYACITEDHCSSQGLSGACDLVPTPHPAVNRMLNIHQTSTSQMLHDDWLCNTLKCVIHLRAGLRVQRKRLAQATSFSPPTLLGRGCSWGEVCACGGC